ncbi:unnamed protein product (macronuclear) [Paramecium tetraurelia]|uniref:Transmembrane protein n=1 Tax=Paramecium tetraurelia TaxID=5888 RepID=A0CRE2_PARTE|nr:uncharacterized protein GSPATT00009674001 [Paramecium tetraurelia]CAK73359.1 unnamed protein product [Paramecium tetraurelia]|eukprot:XP_001440756.1 hypothetical protein (macronuclear) [Paramecium tetraurelia strain d4-2]
MNNNYILLYGSLSGFFSEIVGNLLNFWTYTGYYHSCNPFLTNRLFEKWDEKKKQNINLFIDLFELVFQKNKASKDQQLNCQMMQSGAQQHGVLDFIQQKAQGQTQLKKIQILRIQVNFYILLYLEALHNFASHQYYKYGIFFKVNHSLGSTLPLAKQYFLEHLLGIYFLIQIELMICSKGFLKRMMTKKFKWFKTIALLNFHFLWVVLHIHYYTIFQRNKGQMKFIQNDYYFLKKGQLYFF